MAQFYLFFKPIYSKLQGIGLHQQFLSCCEKWVRLLERIEETLKMSVADSLPALLEQQKAYEVTCAPHPRAGGQGKMNLFIFVNPY